MRMIRILVLAAMGCVLLLPATAAQAQQQEGGEAIRGTIVQRPEEGDPVPVPGVDIAVTTGDGEDVGTVTTAEDGSYAEAFEATLGKSGVETPELPKLDECPAP